MGRRLDWLVLVPALLVPAVLVFGLLPRLVNSPPRGGGAAGGTAVTEVQGVAATPAPTPASLAAALAVATATPAAAPPAPVPTLVAPMAQRPRPTPAPATPAPPPATAPPVVAAAPPRATVPPAAPAAPPSDSSPAAAVQRFYSLVESGQYTQAARLWTPRMRAQFPPEENINQRFSGTRAVAIEQADVVELDQAAGRATVAVAVREDTRTSSQRYVGTWDLVRDSASGTWLLDAPNLQRG